MNTRFALLGALLGTLALPAPCQETAPEQPSVERLIERLGDARWKVREQAERALRDKGEEVVEELRKAADGHEDAEVRWRAARVLRHIRGGREGGLRKRGEAPSRPRAGGRDIGSMFDSVFEMLERRYGLDVPRRSFFEDEFFKDLESQMRAMRERMERARQGFAPDVERGESMRMQVGPDGVRVEIRSKDEDGEIESKVYEAPDLETFRRKYPEIAERHLGGSGLRLRFDEGFEWPRVGDRPGEGWFPWRPEPFRPFVQPDFGGGPRLGVYVEAVPGELRERLDLDEGRGLHVTEVLDGSLAARLGIVPGDVVVEVDGHAVGSPADVRDALSRAGDEVRVEVYRDGERETLRADRRPDEAGSGGLRKRRERAKPRIR